MSHLATATSAEISPNTLYVVATPIGNRDDITLRALAILRGVDAIVCEDTRHSGPLLRHYGIEKPLISLHDHNEQSRLAGLLVRLRGGAALALISDAGTPLISDPGFPLVRAVRGEGMAVVPIPGPSSLLAALMAAGLPTDRFVFEGFLPAKGAARQGRIAELASETRTLVLLESSHRIQDSLQALAEGFGEERWAAIARELTKRFEQIQLDRLGALISWLQRDSNHQRGEFVLVVQGADRPDPIAVTPEALRILQLLQAELPLKRAAAVTAQITGVAKNALYSAGLAQRGGVGRSS